MHAVVSAEIKDEHRDDDDMLIALGEIESELTSKKYGLVWEQHEEAVDVMMRNKENGLYINNTEYVYDMPDEK